MTRLRAIIAAGAIASVSSCGDATASRTDLELARLRWGRSGPTSYSIVLTRGCECLPSTVGPVMVVVRFGAIESRLYASTGAPVPPSVGEAFPDVHGLFNLIDEALESGAAHISVRYDPALGYPTFIDIDQQATTVDDEFSYRLTGFTPR